MSSYRSARPTQPASKGALAAIRSKYGDLPLSFEANAGQTSPEFQFVAHGNGYNLLLSSQETVVSSDQQIGTDPYLAKLDAKTQKKLENRPFYHALARVHSRHARHNVRIEFDGANPHAQMQPLDELPGKTNYFLGSDRRKWLVGIRNYGRVRYVGLYPGVDLVYHGNQHQLEFDFVVSPGGDPGTIALKFAGQDHMNLASDGTVRLGSGHDAVLLRRPSVYQFDRGKKQIVQGGFTLLADGRIGVRVGPYDKSRPLIIDRSWPTRLI